MKARKMFFATFFAAVAAMLLVAAAPLAVSAAPAIRDLSMNRSTITSGQNIRFDVQTTSDVQFVFAMADGVRTTGTRGTGNNWTVNVSPTRSTTVTIFANTSNNESGAARVAVPIVVTGTAAATPTPPAVTIPSAPANLGPIAIASVTETPALRAGEVQLTVVTGRESSEVWVNFDRTNNQRGTGRFARGTMQSQGAHYRVWVINFRPAAWAAQRVEIGSNRTYNWPGAATEHFDVTLAQPFVQAADPRISRVEPSSRSVGTNQNVTFEIRTNADVEYVWVRTVDGSEYNATRQSGTGANRNWRVTFNPRRSGNVAVYANVTRDTAGAARRTENITVGAVVAQIVGTPTAHLISTWQGINTVRIDAVTNEHAQTVWAVVDGRRVQMHRTGSGTGNRTWTVQTEDWGGTITVHATNETGNIHNLHSQASRNAARGGTGHVGAGSITNIQFDLGHGGTVHRGQAVNFIVTTTGVVNSIQLAPGSNATLLTAHQIGGMGGQWQVTIQVPNTTISNFTVQLIAFGHGGHEVGRATTPSINIQ